MPGVRAVCCAKPAAAKQRKDRDISIAFRMGIQILQDKENIVNKSGRPGSLLDEAGYTGGIFRFYFYKISTGRYRQGWYSNKVSAG